jgi:ubiquinone/menaquinone biosynthesis C-methylase UbiE
MNNNINGLLEAISSFMQIQRRDRILVVGAGDGETCRWLAPQVEEGLVIGLDASDEQVRDARVKSTAFEDILYLWASPEQIPWQENFFTIALCVDLVASFGDLEKVLRELSRVLEPGGAVWIVMEDLLKGNVYATLLGRLGFEAVISRDLPPSAANPRGAMLVSARKTASPESDPAAG